MAFLKSAGYVAATFHSVEPLSDGTSHETIEEGFQKVVIDSRDYEFISFSKVMNYATNETNDWLNYKTRNLIFYSNIRDEIKELQMPVGDRARFLHKNVKISFARDRYAYVGGSSYSIKSLILREKK